MNKILSVEGLHKTFRDGTESLKDINFSLCEGEFLIIAGKNGSGKTVLMKHLNGLLKPSSGKVLLKGEDIHKNITGAREKIGLIFQNADSQLIGITVKEDIAFGPRNLRLSKQEVENRVLEAAQAVSVESLLDKNPHTLSGGEKKRVTIAGVLAMNPDILIFDEPFTGLDYPGVVDVLTQILRLHSEGHNIILITHDLEKVLAHATRLIILGEGQIQEDGSPEELLTSLEKWGIRRPVQRNFEEITWL